MRASGEEEEEEEVVCVVRRERERDGDKEAGLLFGPLLYSRFEIRRQRQDRAIHTVRVEMFGVLHASKSKIFSARKSFEQIVQAYFDRKKIVPPL